MQSTYLRSTLVAFSSMVEEEDPMAVAQASHYLSLCYAHVRGTKVAQLLAQRATDILHRNNIRFVMPNGDDSPPRFSEEAHERAAFLCHMIYSKTFQSLVSQPFRGKFDEQVVYELSVSSSLGFYVFD
jgi:hypothetical protein